MLIEVKQYEAKFIGMPVGREPSIGPKKGKLIRSQESANLGDVGDMDARKDSPTYGNRTCVVGKLYELDQWQLDKYGAAFEVLKELKGYVIDDGRTDEVEELARKQYKKDAQDRQQAAAKDAKAEVEKTREEEEKRIAEAKVENMRKAREAKKLKDE